MFDLILARGWQAIHSLLHASASAIHSSTRRDDDRVRLRRTQRQRRVRTFKRTTTTDGYSHATALRMRRRVRLCDRGDDGREHPSGRYGPVAREWLRWEWLPEGVEGVEIVVTSMQKQTSSTQEKSDVMQLRFEVKDQRAVSRAWRAREKWTRFARSRS